MSKFILARKLHMSQLFDRDGNVQPVTVLSAGPVVVTRVTPLKDGDSNVEVGYHEYPKAKKPAMGKLKGTPMEGKGARWFRSFRVEDAAPERGAMIDVSVFAEGDHIMVSSVSKGKGFQGVVKRHDFRGASSTHGVKHAHRQPGSIGGGLRTRVPKGMRMAGRMGGERVSVRNLTVVKVDSAAGQLFVRGAVPGHRGSLVEIRG